MPIPDLFCGYRDALMRGASSTALAVSALWCWWPFRKPAHHFKYFLVLRTECGTPSWQGAGIFAEQRLRSVV